MSCPLCERAILKGQWFVQVRGFVTVRNAYGQPVSEPLMFEDGTNAKYAHYGCFLKRCDPSLIGIHWGEPDLGEPPNG
jgi:hypothetical protein